VLPDGGPPSWAMAMAGPLGSAPGLQHYSHCQEASQAIVATAGRLVRSGEIQLYKAYSIL